MPYTSNRPQAISVLSIQKDYEYGRPQTLFNVQPPLPPGIDNELIEEVAGVFDNMIYNETGSGNDGQVQISSIPASASFFIVHEETTGVFGNLVEEETTGVFNQELGVGS